MRDDVRSALVGALAGMRSSSAPALVSQIRARKSDTRSPSRSVLGAMFVGQLIAERLPFLPRRTRSLSLLTRLVSGASSAAKLDGDGNEKLRAALLGAAGAIGASLLFYQLRKELEKRYDMPEYLLALGEDVLLIGLAVWLLKQSDQASSTDTM